MKSKLLLFAFILFITNCFSQNIQITPITQPTNGGRLQNGNLILDFTIGEPHYGTLQNNNLMVAGGFQQPEIPQAPGAPASQTVCSDTVYTFTFANVRAGAGGDQVEWSTNISFTGSVIVGHDSAIHVSVPVGTVDTIWIRSRVSGSGVVSTTIVFTILRVNEIPNATLNPNDTMVYSGQTISITANGGTSYYWRQLNDSSPTITATINKDTIFDVIVSNTYGCSKTLSAYVFIIDTTFYQSEPIDIPFSWLSLLNQPTHNYYKITALLDPVFENDTSDFEEDGDRARYYRWRKFWRTRVAPDGDMTAAGQALNEYFSEFDHDCDVFSENKSWKNLGPDFVYENGISLQKTGRFDAVWGGAPASDGLPNLIYAGSRGGGLFKGVRAGDEWSWKNISDIAHISGFGVLSIAVNPNDNDEIWVSTGTLDANFTSWGVGLIHSNDGGETWEIDDSFPLFDGINLPICPLVKYAPGTNVLFATSSISLKDSIYTTYTPKLYKRVSGNWTECVLTSSKGFSGSFILNNLEFIEGMPQITFFVSGDDESGDDVSIWYSENAGDSCRELSDFSQFKNLISNTNSHFDANVISPNSQITSGINWYNSGTGQSLGVHKWNRNGVLNCAVIRPRVFNPDTIKEQLLVYDLGEGNSIYGGANGNPLLGGGPRFTFKFNFTLPAKCVLRVYLAPEQSINDSVILPDPLNPIYKNDDPNTNLPTPNGWLLFNSKDSTNIPVNASDSVEFHLEFINAANPGWVPFYRYILFEAVADSGYNQTSGSFMKLDDVELYRPGFCTGRISAVPDTNLVYCAVTSASGTRIVHATVPFTAWDTSYVDVSDSTPVSSVFRVSAETNSINEHVMYTGKFFPYKSIDGGKNFNVLMATNQGDQACPSNPIHVDVRAFELYHSNHTATDGVGDIILIGNDGGIGLKKADSSVFANINGTGLIAREYYGIAGTELDKDFVIGGAQDNGCFEYTGEGWKHILGGDGYESFINNEGVLFNQDGSGGSNLSDVKYCKDNDLLRPNETDNCNSYCANNYAHWTGGGSVTNGVPYVKRMKEGADNKIFVGTDHLNIVIKDTTDNYVLQQEVSNHSKAHGYVRGLDVGYDSLGKEEVYVLFDGGGCTDTAVNLFRWKDSAYTAITTPWLCWPATDVVVNPNNTNEIWYSMGGFSRDNQNVLQPDVNRIRYSCDGGQTWVDRSKGLPPFPVNRLIYHKGTNDVIYAATDVGVYVWIPNYTTHNCTGDSTAGHWDCFSNGLPVCIVSDIEINYCGRKLKAGTWGRGLWEIDLPEFTLPEAEHIAGTNAIGNARVDHDIIIDSGAVVSITNSIVTFTQDRSVIIMPGGKLKIDNSTLTDACNCMWKGIQVRGKRSEHQIINNDSTSNQGYLIINNSTVQNAHEAIRVWDPTYTNDSIGTGGIVQAIGSTFKNNRRSLEMMSYHNIFNGVSGPIDVNNLSYFKNCTFITDSNHRTEHPFSVHATMWDVNGVQFQSCAFKNDNIRSTVGQLGHGIYSIDANYNVKNSTFKGFWHGLWANGGWRPTTVNITGCIFEDNFKGASLYNTTLSTVADNTFKSGKVHVNTSGISYFDPQDVIVGAELNGSNLFTFENNNFEAMDDMDSLYTFYTTGTWANNTGVINNEISKNTYDALPFGIGVNGENRDGLGFTGLKMGCNEHTTQSVFDFFVQGDNDTSTFDGVRRLQGEINTAIGNEFNMPIFNGDTVTEGHYFNHASQPIYYNWFDTVQKPVYYSNTITLVKVINDAACNADTVSYCYWCLLNSTEISAYSSSLNNFHSILTAKKDTLYSLMDEGNTPNLLADIDTTTLNGAITMRNRLLANAPYISAKTVIKIGRKASIFNDTMFLDIVSANPDVKFEGRFSDYYTDKSKFLPVWITDSIARLSAATARTVRQNEITYYADTVHHLVKLLARDAVNDTSGIRHQSLRNYLKKLETAEAGLLIAKDLMATNELAEADSIITVLANASVEPEEKEQRQQQVTVARIQLRSLVNGNGITQICSADKDSLILINGMVLQDDSVYSPRRAKYASGTLAGNILRSFYQTDSTKTYWEYYEEPKFPTVSGHTRSAKKDDVEEVKEKIQELKDMVKVFPNPAKNVLYVLYETTEPEVYIRIADLLGREMTSKKTISGKNIEVFATQNWSNGTYIYEVKSLNKKIGSGLFMISQ